MKSKVLVTGGAGFIGSHLVDTLLADGMQTLVIDNFDDYYDRKVKEKNISGHLSSPHYELVEADIRDRNRMEHIFEQWKPEIVVHLAAKAGVRPSLEIPHEYVDVNLAGTVNLLDASVKNGVSKFIFASSSSVYGLNEEVPFSESGPTLKIASPYGATKAAGEALCQSYSHCFGLPIAALRFFTVYGPRQRPDLAIHKFARKMARNEPITLYGDGTTSRDYTYVSDIVSGIRKSMELHARDYEAFNLGNDNPTSLLALVHLLEDAMNTKALIDWQPLQIGDVPKTWADYHKAQSMLGYSPSTNLETGIKHFVEWLREEESLLP
ncbi:SDR family NAD(P)-dependent oxidoreductase [Paenibacillus sedimenti]|uniref:SDR family NAD(P)-dependent oxidoreductase n=1 Tax=Paenibacillus sedimenti TaxID=2770274 RepID=A0A926KQF8_9BACL|nr:SDR family NAD(P)-dependent oxidoreductase [Paenibacillus sedimenti]MBD0381577.1 SDR family NAD(P)-dependent oxidoreductase [Paenibacillus sedimenti]